MVNKKAKWHLRKITRMYYVWDVQHRKKRIQKPFHQVLVLLLMSLVGVILCLPDTIPVMVKWAAIILGAPALWYGYRSSIKSRYKGLSIHSSCSHILNWHFTNYPIHNEQARENLQELQNFLTSVKSDRCVCEDQISEFNHQLSRFIDNESVNLGVREPPKRTTSRIAVNEKNSFEFVDRDLSIKSPASSDCQ